MNKNEIIKILEDWNFWKITPETGISRDYYLNQLAGFIKTGQIVIITGPRRSGKSFIMRQFAKILIENGTSAKNVLIVNFEDPRLPELNASSLDQIYNYYLEFLSPDGPIFIFLDEIQEVAGWEKWVNTMQELKKAQIIISGSNAKLLSRELATVLTGRHLDLAVLPLSFREYLDFKKISIKDEIDLIHYEVNIKGLLRKYLEEGAYPAVVLSEKKKEILLAYFEDIINKDLIRRYKIKKGEKLKSLAKFYLTQTASLITFNSAAKNIEITAATAEKFSTYLESAYLTFFLKRFSYKVKEQDKSPRKIYAVDTGLANSIGFKFSDNWGRIMENAVFLELKRQQYINPGIELFYWKDIHHKEVDFVVKEGQKVIELIQVSCDISRTKTKTREVNSLFKAMDEFKLTRALVITEDQEFEEEINQRKVRYVPLWKWLLKQS